MCRALTGAALNEHARIAREERATRLRSLEAIAGPCASSMSVGANECMYRQ